MTLKNLFTGQREKDTENRLMDLGRREERVRCTERVTWKLTICEGAKATQMYRTFFWTVWEKVRVG